MEWVELFFCFVCIFYIVFDFGNKPARCVGLPFVFCKINNLF